MGCNTGNIYETFIIEQGSDNPYTGCTGYFNDIFSCGGNTAINMGLNTIIFSGNLFTSNSISASTLLSGNTDLINIINDSMLTGGTFDKNSSTLTLSSVNKIINISGFTDNDQFTTGGTFNNGTLSLISNSGNTISVSGFTTSGVDTYTTGSTKVGSIATFTNNTGGTYNLTGLTDTFITGATYSNGALVLTNNSSNATSVAGFFTGYTCVVNTLSIGFGLSANTNNGDVTILNTAPDKLVGITGGTNIVISGMYPNFGIDLTGVTDNTFITGGTVSRNNSLSTIGLTDNSNSTVSIGSVFDTFITGGTYNNSVLSLINNSGNTVSVTVSSTTIDTYTTGATKSNTIATFTNNTGGTYNLTGLTDTFTTGATYSNGVLDITNNNGITVSANGFYTGNTDMFITGGTVSRSGNLSDINLTNNTGGTFTVSSVFDTFITGGTYNNGVVLLADTSGNTISINNLFTGYTSVVNTLTTGIGLSANTTSGNITIVNTLPDQVVTVTGNTNISIVGNYPNFGINLTGLTDNNTFITGGTIYRSGNLSTINLVNNSGDTILINSIFDTYTTGGTYSNGTINLVTNSGNTISIGGFFTGQTDNDRYITGGTISRVNNLSTINLTSNSGTTVSVSNIFDTFTTGATLASGVATFTNNSGGTFTLSGFPNAFTTGFTYDNANTLSLQRNQNQSALTVDIGVMTGLTVNGSVSANTYNGNNLNLTGATSIVGINTSATTPSFITKNSVGYTTFEVRNDGGVTIGQSNTSGAATAALTVRSNSTGNDMIVGNALLLAPPIIQTIRGANNALFINLGGDPTSAGNGLVLGAVNRNNQTATGEYNVIAGLTGNLGQQSSSFNYLKFGHTINLNNLNTTPSAISRGIYYNPTVTNLTGIGGTAQHRAWENTTGNMIFGSTSGSVGINTTTPAQKLDVVGIAQATQFKVSALNTAPISGDVCITGEVRITNNGIYWCIATNSWLKVIGVPL